MLQHLLFTDPDDLLNFRLIIAPDEGFYRNGRFSFNFKIGPSYPHEPPKVKCVTKIYHPNIDLGKNSFYRLTYHVMDLGWVDLNLGGFRLLGLGSVLKRQFCKSNSTQVRYVVVAH